MYYFVGPIWVGVKDNGAFRDRGAKHLAPQDSTSDKVSLVFIGNARVFEMLDKLQLKPVQIAV